MTLKKVISGAQTGADIAGLEVAKKFGLETGGLMPFGYKTQDGPKTEYREMYGVEIHQSSSYVPRTRANVRDSDGTIRLAFDFESRGEVCTKKAIDDYNKPTLDIALDEAILINDEVSQPLLYLAIGWIKNWNIEVLNIAGNSESTFAGTHDASVIFLTELFKGLGLCEGSQAGLGEPSDLQDKLL